MRRVAAQIGPLGAFIDVEIGICELRRKAYSRAKKVPPAPIRVTMLVDTGASHTFIEEGALAPLDLTPRDRVEFHSASTQDVPEECNVYDVDLRLGRMVDANVLSIDPLEIMATKYINRRHQGLLGRDVLGRMQLAWNGLSGTFELLYP